MKQPEKTCCFTGHREIPSEDLAPLKKRLRKEIVSLIHNGVLYFGTGGARGFDMLAAQTILKLKKRYPQIKLLWFFPVRNTLSFGRNAISLITRKSCLRPIKSFISRRIIIRVVWTSETVT